MMAPGHCRFCTKRCNFTHVLSRAAEPVCGLRLEAQHGVLEPPRYKYLLAVWTQDFSAMEADLTDKKLKGLARL